MANELYENDGSGRFTLVTGTSISDGRANTYTIAVLDMDNDDDVRTQGRAPRSSRDASSTAAPRLCSLT